jgi:hypothetical protein
MLLMGEWVVNFKQGMYSIGSADAMGDCCQKYITTCCLYYWPFELNRGRSVC